MPKTGTFLAYSRRWLRMTVYPNTSIVRLVNMQSKKDPDKKATPKNGLYPLMGWKIIIFSTLGA